MDDGLVEIDLHALGNLYEGATGDILPVMVGMVAACIPASITIANMFGR